jgi:hypothetical protein
MKSRFQIHPLRLIVSACVIGILIELNRISSITDRVLLFLWLAFLVLGSVILLVRGWRVRNNPVELQRALHGGQLGILPRKWRRWVLGEDD